MKKLLILLAAVSLTPLTAIADVVTLKDNSVLQGEVIDEGKTLLIKGKYGSIRVDKSKVIDWKNSSPQDDAFKKKKAQLGDKTADARYRLGVWARGKRMDSNAQQSFESVLLLNPDHPGARAALGYVKHQGIWLTQADKARMEGKVKYRGRWITLDEKADIMKNARLAKEKKEKDKIAQIARKKLRRNLAREKNSSNRSRRQAQPRVRHYDPDRTRLLDNYYGPYYPGPVSGYRLASGAYGNPYFLGPRAFPLYRGIAGRGLTYQQQLIAAAALRQGRILPLHLTQPLRVIQSPGFRSAPYFRPVIQRPNGFNLGVNRSFSNGRSQVRFRVGGSSRRSFSNGQSFSGNSFGSAFSGSYRRGNSRVQFRFNP
jgi:hypothetical protein